MESSEASQYSYVPENEKMNLQAYTTEEQNQIKRKAAVERCKRRVDELIAKKEELERSATLSAKNDLNNLAKCKDKSLMCHKSTPEDSQCSYIAVEEELSDEELMKQRRSDAVARNKRQLAKQTDVKDGAERMQLIASVEDAQYA